MVAAEVKVGTRRGGKRGRRAGEGNTRPWKVAVVAESSIRVMGSSAGGHGRRKENRESEEREE